MALSCEPELLIADEPIMVPRTHQAQILRLLIDLKDEFNAGIVFITDRTSESSPRSVIVSSSCTWGKSSSRRMSTLCSTIRHIPIPEG